MPPNGRKGDEYPIMLEVHSQEITNAHLYHKVCIGIAQGVSLFYHMENPLSVSTSTIIKATHEN